ncbi:MAG: segregation/condensation protein A, partial [Spirochaetales bacterium]|nr:segregation/condensation protein A [Spirochaetales bacterium]
RSKKQRPLPFEDDGVWEEIDVWDLLQTFSTIMSSLSFERVVDLYEEVSVNEKITLINELIEREGSFSFNSLIANAHSIMDFICAFLAVLETVKMKQIRVLQNQLFGDIRITRYQQED